MVLDSSALVSIVMEEPGSDDLLTKIQSAPRVSIGAPVLVEALIVLTHRLRGDPSHLLAELLEALDIEVIAFRRDHSEVAHAAYLRFGKGRHRAALNFGDCLAYTTAAVDSEPLLYVGDDFSQTDIERA